MRVTQIKAIFAEKDTGKAKVPVSVNTESQRREPGIRIEGRWTRRERKKIIIDDRKSNTMEQQIKITKVQVRLLEILY